MKELEKERADLLKAIENKAQQLSSKRSKSADNKEHNLKDWLSAAENIIPSDSDYRGSSKNNKKPTQVLNKPQKSWLFISIIIFSLIIGASYIAYISINKEFTQVKTSQERNATEVELLKDLIIELEQKIDIQEKKIKYLKDISSVKSSSDKKITSKSNTQEKLVYLESQIEKINQIDLKLKKLIQKKENDNLKIARQEQTPITNDLNKLAFKVLEKITKPLAATKSIKNYSVDAKWLMNQPLTNYTLQLASLPNKDSAKKLIKDKSIEGGKIIIQHDPDPSLTKYIVIIGSYSDIKEANDYRQKYKEKFGIISWLRNVKNIVPRVK